MRDFSDYIAALPANHVEALHQICTDFFEMHGENHQRFKSQFELYQQHEYQMFYRIALKFITTFNLDINLSGNLTGNQNILNFFKSFDVAVSGWLAEQFFEQKYAPTTDSVQFSPEKAQMLQEKTNELRDVVRAADYLEEKHQRNLLLKLEKFQTELHKSISSLDVFLAGWADINDMVEDTGNKAKPIVDRFKDLMAAVKRKEPAQIEVDEKPKQITDQTDTEETEE